MDNLKFVQNIDLSNIQIDYNQMQIPFINNILNSNFLGLNNLDFGLRLFIILLFLAIFISVIIKLISLIEKYLKKIFQFINRKYENFSEKKFNMMSSNELNKHLVNLNSFIIVCDFEFQDKNVHPEKLIEFSKTFLINHNANVKYNKKSVIFKFIEFHKIINGVITQLYLAKTVFEQKYPEIKIYLSCSAVEKEENYEEQLELIKSFNQLKISTKYLACDTIFKLYYSLIKPQLYELQSHGAYLIQNRTIEIYTITPPVDRTL